MSGTASHRRWYGILIFGWMLWVISLAVPAVSANNLFGSDIHSGLEAAGYAITGIFLDSPWYGVPSGLTNVFILVSLRAVRRPEPSLAFGLIMIGLAVFNLGWLTEPLRGDYDQLLTGYYLWIVAFGIVGIAHLLGYAKVWIRDEGTGPPE